MIQILSPKLLESWKSYARMLDQCDSVQRGKQIHRYLFSLGFNNDNHLFLSNHLLNMYIQCGSLQDAQLLFDSMSNRNSISWSAMIRGNGEVANFPRAVLLFRTMLHEGTRPDMVLFLTLIKAVPENSLSDAVLVRGFIETCGFLDGLMVGTALIGMYGKCGRLELARDVFDQISEPNSVSWNALITVCWRNGGGEESVALFREMQLEGVRPTRVTFISVARACAEVQNFRWGKFIHNCASEAGVLSDSIVGNAIMNMYDKCSRVECARSVFESMPRKDVSSWNTMIAAFAQNGHLLEAFRVYKAMLEKDVQPDHFTFVNVLEACDSPEELDQGERIHTDVREYGFESDLVVGTALVSMYRRCGSLDNAVKMFDRIQHPTVVSCNSIIATYADYGHVSESLLYFRRMLQQGIRPSKFTFITVLSACATKAALSQGRFIHELITESSPESRAEVLVHNALVNMYAKCGKLQRAREIFDQIMSRGIISSWNAIISAYAQHGSGEDAVEIFSELQQVGILPDGITYTAVLSATSHARLVEQGCQLFYGIQHDYGMKPSVEHYGCVTDLLGRAGWLEEAERFVKRMPFQADAAAWMALLGACRMYGDEERGAKAAEKVVELEPKHAGSYTVLSNMYSAAGRWEDAEKVRKLMAEKGVKKEPGCSWIEVRNRMHEFVVKDRSHPRSEEIYTELERLSRKLKEEGYVPDMRSVFHDVEDEHKENLLWHHSEKLALAFGLISLSSKSDEIRIMKNLRICDDCHLVFKLVSRTCQREITVRDCYRFHHFKDGICSCKDCW